MKTLRLVLVVLAACSGPEDGPFTFGVVADIQYADKDTAGSRRYREATSKLSACVEDWNGRELAFAVQLGDIVDGRRELGDSLTDLDAVLAVLSKLETPLHHVIGNHCLSVPRATLRGKLGVDRYRDSFARGGWRFVVLDGMDVNVLDATTPEARRRVQDFMDAHPRARGRMSIAYNGGIGPEQLAWLREVLAGADRDGERVVAFCHFPILAAAADEGLLLWNHEEVLDLLEQHPSTAVWMCGHHHAGGYAERNGIHHVTVQGMLDAPRDGNAYATVTVHPQRLVVHGVGTVTSRVLDVSRR